MHCFRNLLIIKAINKTTGNDRIPHLNFTNGISNKSLALRQVNALYEEMVGGTNELNPYETKFFRVSW